MTESVRGFIFLTSACFLPLPMQAAVVIIGGSVNNGDFNADTSIDDQRTFDETPNWENLGTGDQTLLATRTNLPTADGSRNAIVAQNDARDLGLNTGYDLVEGEELSLSYEWRDANNWDDASDQLVVNIFITDTDAIDGTRTTLATELSGLSSNNNTYQTFTSNNFLTVGATAAGKTLFVEITTQDGNANPNGFVRLDNFMLTSNVPEPSSAALLGLGGLALILRRRK